MVYLVIVTSCLAVFVAGLVGITLGVPLQAPAAVLLGFSGILTAGLLARLCVGQSNASGPDRKEPQSWVLLLCITSAVFFVLRAVFSPVWALAVDDLMLILPAAVLYLVAGHGVGGRAGVRLRQCLAGMVVLLLLLHMGSAVIQLAGGEGYTLVKMFISAGRSSEGAVTGMYGYRGSFANFSVMSGLLCLSLGVWGRFSFSVRLSVFLLGCTALLLAVVAQSRSAAISLVVGLIVLGCALYMSAGGLQDHVRRRVRGVVGVLGALSILGCIVGGALVFKERATSGAVGADVVFDSEVRFAFWSMAMEQWADSPIVGAGSRSYSYECFRYWNPNLPTHSGNPEFVHNEYLQLLSDYGLVGLLLVLGIIGGHLFVGFGRVRDLSGKMGEGGLKRGSNAIALAIAGISGLVAMGVHICFDYRTHIQANLLLSVCCAVWVLPVARVQEKRVRNGLVAVVVLFLGGGAVGLGWQQLWAGMPLLEKGMAKEDGAWNPQGVDRSVWIPALEESLGRMPHWRRYERLGVLYQLESELADGATGKDTLGKAKEAYQASIGLHPYNPIPQINLAMIHTAGREWEMADAAYQHISRRAMAREHWFRLHQRWGEMHRLWAKELWSSDSIRLAEMHYKRSQQLYLESKRIATPHDLGWRNAYLGASIDYVYFLLSAKRYDDALQLIERCEKEAGKSRMLRVRADYFFHYGKFLWHERRPEEAMTCLYKARNHYLSCRRWNKEAVDEHWQKNFRSTEEIIRFLKLAGIRRTPSD